MIEILVVDNYDSFTFNLVHYLERLECKVTTIKNDEPYPIDIEFQGIVLSPGPGLPSDAGKLMEILKQKAGVTPILGVCLGMQAIGLYLGGKIYNQHHVKHGVSEKIKTRLSTLFTEEGVQEVGLYHSWAIDGSGDYIVSAESESNIVMAIERSEEKLFGVQFHPESVLTENGLLILKNFLNFCNQIKTSNHED